MAYLPTGVAEMLRGSVNLGVFIRVMSSPALHFWMGVGERTIGIESSGDMGGDVATYIGAGRIIDIPDLEVLINGIADQVTLSLSVEEELFKRYLSGLDDMVPDMRGVDVMIGFAPMDARWQAVSQIIPLWSGVGDFLGVKQTAGEGPDRPAIRTISLAVGVGDTSRMQPRQMNFTSAAQNVTYPTDRFFERVSRYVQQFIVSWPRY